jgi:hypothetical protein
MPARVLILFSLLSVAGCQSAHDLWQLACYNSTLAVCR